MSVEGLKIGISSIFDCSFLWMHSVEEKQIQTWNVNLEISSYTPLHLLPMNFVLVAMLRGSRCLSLAVITGDLSQEG
jgi:hypothetical protein